LGFKAEICNSPSNLDEADKIILPGVGSFSDAMKCLKEENWLPVINNHVADKERPLLGICLGMQLLAEYGTEGGEVEGLGYIPGNVKHLEKLGCKQRIPHVGWNNVNIVEENMLYSGISSGPEFYFVHSYAFNPSDKRNISATVTYTNEIVASVQKNNIFGTQFHPEKSSKAGLRVLKNFLLI
ncbi:MAG: imidazole glycerol phosphate synthase subunit HisH, partial [Bdellovibrionota bacterium]|nr:imidazole glycerol phosphate synthase subunit HisH [Bdellovibrionota bacterium]